MPDFIGAIEVPSVLPSGTFPLTWEYPHQSTIEPIVKEHRFEAGNGKIEQRFYLGKRARRWRFQKRTCSNAEVKALRDFWEARQGPYQPFTANVPNDGPVLTGGGETIQTEGGADIVTEPGGLGIITEGGGWTDTILTPTTVAFESPILSLEHLNVSCAAGLVFVEVPTSTPSYTVLTTLERFPDAMMETAMESQVQEFIPLLKIRVKDAAVADVFVSDRRCTVGGQLYLERMTGWGPLTQSINGSSDEFRASLGNADRVMALFAADTRLDFARLEFSLYHVNTQTLLNLYTGPLAEFHGEAALEMQIVGRDWLFDTRISAPSRMISRRCWKKYNDGVHCPFATQGALNVIDYPSASAGACDRGFDTPNGCDAHGMADYHGGQPAFPQKVQLKGFKKLFGGKPSTSSASIVDDSVYDQVIPLIFTDVSIPVKGLVVAGRDESEFYAALGVVGEGPLGSFAASGHRLDGFAHHGPGSTGLITVTGTDPQAAPFALSELSPPPGGYPERAAGTAWGEIRRGDEKGIQIGQKIDHAMQFIVDGGLKIHKWVAGVRQAEAVNTNNFWIAAYVYLRTFGYHRTVAATLQEAMLDVPSIEACATIADTSIVTPLIGSGPVTQFKFVGFLDQNRPVRDWLSEILRGALGYYTFKNGKLRVGCRADSASLEAFTTGNVIWGSYEPFAFPSRFNHLTLHYGLREVGSDGIPTLTGTPLPYADQDAAEEESQTGQPLYRKAQLNLPGTHTQDEAARVATVLVREEVGGITAAHRKKARGHRWASTILGLATEPGMVISLNGLAGLPETPAEVRIENWVLTSDYMLRFEGRTSRDEMYDLVQGSTAVDVIPDTPPDEVASQLAAGNVTGFSASEDPEVQPDGTVLSLVSVNFAEPVPLGTYRGVRIEGQDLDTTLTNGSGTPTNDWRVVADFPEEASPTAREFRTAVTGLAMRMRARSYNSTVLNGPTGAPETEVLLDGKQSPPTEPTDLWCQHLPLGEKLSWQKNPENDLKGYLLAHTWDKEPYDLISAGGSAIKNEQVVATIPPGNDDGDRSWFSWDQKFYEMDIAGSVLTLTGTTPKEWAVDQLLVETSSGVFTGAALTIFYPDGTSETRTVSSNTAAAITVTSAPSATGRVKVRLGGSSNEQRFYLAAFDTSGNISNWVAFPECTPFAPDGTLDIGPTDAYTIDVPVGSDPVGITRCAWFCGNGYVNIWFAAKGGDGDGSDSDTAPRRSINGIVAWEARIWEIDMVTYHDFRYPVSATPSDYTYFPVMGGRPVPFWTLLNANIPPIWIPDIQIWKVEFRARNAFGWCPWEIGASASFNKTAYTGNNRVERVITQDPVSAALSPNIGRSGHLQSNLTGNITLNPAEVLPVSGTPGTGSDPEFGEIFHLTIKQDATGGRAVTLDSAYVGVRAQDINPLPNAVTNLLFVVEDDGGGGVQFRCINVYSPIQP